MRQVKLTLPDDVADWLDSELGASHGTRGTVAGDIVQAVFHASRSGERSAVINKKRIYILIGRRPVLTEVDS